jgi:hypothetical protein
MTFLFWGSFRRHLSIFVISPTTSPRGCFGVMTSPAYPARTTTWNVALASHASDLRRATGRRGAIPGVVVHGSVRVMASVTSKEQVFSVEELRPKDYQRWRDLRRQLRQREEARRQQWRFRKHPATYLAEVEARLLVNPDRQWD